MVEGQVKRQWAFGVVILRPTYPNEVCGNDTNYKYQNCSLPLPKLHYILLKTAMASHISQAELKQFYIGKDIADVPKPAAVLDVAIIRRHCETMLRTIKKLNVGFRAHVKSHKVDILSFLSLLSHPWTVPSY